ncbi:YciI family protein [Bosea sp. 2KB_26]|uniref:YciI family protein n=1 Tax=Bosea sp. 2KB_26 TaxID=3237475 RepID=UPI003F8E6C8A
MLYTVLCYHDEDITAAWSREEEAAVVDQLIAVHDKWGGTFRPVVRLMPTNTATSVRKSGTLVTDGPFAETKEQLLGIYVIEVADLEEALAVARDLGRANPTANYEVRPVMTLVPDAGLAGAS